MTGSYEVLDPNCFVRKVTYEASREIGFNVIETTTRPCSDEQRRMLKGEAASKKIRACVLRPNSILTFFPLQLIPASLRARCSSASTSSYPASSSPHFSKSPRPVERSRGRRGTRAPRRMRPTPTCSCPASERIRRRSKISPTTVWRRPTPS